MPGPNEKEYLTDLLDSDRYVSKLNSSLTFQKNFLLFSFFAFISIIYFGKKFEFLSINKLLFISGLAGMILMGYIFVLSVKNYSGWINDHLDKESISRRLLEIEKEENENKGEW